MVLVDKPNFRRALASTYRLRELSSAFQHNIPLFVKTFPYRSREAFHLPYGYVRHCEDWNRRLRATPWEVLQLFGEEQKLNIALNSIGELEVKGGRISAFHSNLVLGSDIESVKSNISKNFRKNLTLQKNRAHKTGLVIDIETSAIAIQEFHHLLATQYVRHHKMLFQPLELFSRLVAENFAHLITARREGQLVGALFVLYDDKTAYYAWGARDVGEYVAVHTLLIEALISTCISHGIRQIDLGLTAVSDTHLLNYKEKWGAQTSEIYSYWTSKSPAQRDLHNGFPLLRNLYGKVPVGAAKLIAPTIVRALL